jgi:hypothetical protein
MLWVRCRTVEPVDRPDVTEGEAALLVDGLRDDVSFSWVLIHLGLRGNPPPDPSPPTAQVIEAAFETIERLVGAGLVTTGRLEYIDGGPPGRAAPFRHVAESLDLVRQRVERTATADDGWEWSCWTVNTTAGDAIARQILAERA